MNSKITEQTTRVPNMNFGKHIPLFNKSDLTHVGDIDNFGVYTKEGNDDRCYYILFEHDKDSQALVAIFKPTTFQNNYCLEALVSQKYPGYEQQPLLSRLLFFIKSHEDIPILIDQRLTGSGLKFIERLSKSQRFKMTWRHTNTGESQPYSIDTVENFLNDVTPGPWRLLLETSGDPAFWQRGKFLQTDNIDSWYHWFEDSADLD